LTRWTSGYADPTLEGVADVTRPQPIVLALEPDDVSDDLAGNPLKVLTGSVHLSAAGFSGA